MKVSPAFPFPANAPLPGTRWRHRHGNDYRVVCCAFEEASVTPVVVYEGVTNPEYIWTRPLAEFLERFVEVPGVTLKE